MTKKCYSSFSLVALLMLSIPAASQNPIPNAGFETWSGSTPAGWNASTNIPGFLEPITRSTDAYSGVSAVRGEVLNAAGSPYPPALYTGTTQSPLFPISENHSSFSAYYKFQPQGGDMLYIQVAFQNPVTGGGAEGHTTISTSAGSYTRVDISMVYNPNNPPGFQATQANITITIQPPTGQAPHIGTNFLIDHLTFDNYPVSVEELADVRNPERFELMQNYPNPFNPSTNIQFSLPEQSLVQLKVFNLLGEEVASLVNEEMRAGNYRADWNATGMPSGVYLYSLRTGNSVLTKRMMLVK